MKRNFYFVSSSEMFWKEEEEPREWEKGRSKTVMKEIFCGDSGDVI